MVKKPPALGNAGGFNLPRILLARLRLFDASKSNTVAVDRYDRGSHLAFRSRERDFGSCIDCLKLLQFGDELLKSDLELLRECHDVDIPVLVELDERVLLIEWASQFLREISRPVILVRVSMDVDGNILILPVLILHRLGYNDEVISCLSDELVAQCLGH